MNAGHEERSCAVCASGDKRRIFEQRFATAGLVTGYDVVVCRRCGFAFADNIPSRAAFEQYYRDLSKYEYQQRGGSESESDEARLRQIAAALTGLIPARDSRILEVGCASGRLLALLRDAGFSNAAGLDPSPACAKAARALYGVSVRTGSIYSLPESSEKFDFLILIGVLEHLGDLSGALQAIRGALSENGRVCFDVPDCTRFADFPDAPFQQFSTEHINFFSPVSLANLLRTHGFKPLASSQERREYTQSSTIPSVQAVFEKAPVSADWERDVEGEARLLDYLHQSEALDRGLRKTLERTVSGGRPIVVWGIGTLTQRLLATGGLDAANIAAFVDSNPKYHGRRLHGLPVLPPEALRGRSEPILICSRVFQQEIERQIREQLGLTNELLLLYAGDEAAA